MKSIIAALALLPAIASAGDFWGVVNVSSYHLNRDKQYNSFNYGAGLEYHTSKEVLFTAGLYHNSFYKTSIYALAAYTPLNLLGIQFGAAAGVINGYAGLNNGNLTPAIAGLIRIEHGRLGANLLLMPSAKRRVLNVIGLQIKFAI